MAYGHEFIESASQIGNNDLDENRLDSQSVVQYLVVSYARYNFRVVGSDLAVLLTHSISVGRITILECLSMILKYQC